MARIFRRRWLGRLASLAVFGAMTRGRPVPAQQGAVKGQPDDKPSPLWVALLAALPPNYRTIDVYAENPSRTLVLFRSQGETLIFNATTGNVRVIAHRKALGRINQVTFEARSADLSGFVLWLDGVPQLTVLARR